MAERDPTTGLLNRQTFNAEFPSLVSNASASNLPVSVVMVDIDRFKAVNDTHGHQAGDQVLADVAAGIRSVVDGKGSVYRYGGDEFAIVLPNHSVSEATAVAERARRHTEGSEISGLSVTTSFGIGTFPDHAQAATELLACADQALYDAKNLGRNLVRVFGEPPPPRETPREPDRRLPPSFALTDGEKEVLRQQYFRGYAARCPKDDAVLEVHEFQGISDPTPTLRIRCKLCGLNELV